MPRTRLNQGRNAIDMDQADDGSVHVQAFGSLTSNGKVHISATSSYGKMVVLDIAIDRPGAEPDTLVLYLKRGQAQRTMNALRRALAEVEVE